MHQVSVFGEVLFDCFPGGEKILGGAPFNVAWHLQAFGLAPLFVSRVGDDEAGREILQAMRSWGMDTAGVQLDIEHPTGQVAVSLQGGEPSYDIVDRVAYDFIEKSQIEKSASRILYHGSLGLRHSTSRESLQHLRNILGARVFMDVNLRAPWWQREQVLEWVGQADWVKLNEEELASLQGEAGDLHAGAEDFLQRQALQGLVVTRGGEGATLLLRDQTAIDVAPVSALKVVDTVGAGDALASVLLLGLSLDWPLPLALERAQQFASAVVGQRGAISAQKAFYRPFIESWGLSQEIAD
jgi:fructokinase